MPSSANTNSNGCKLDALTVHFHSLGFVRLCLVENSSKKVGTIVQICKGLSHNHCDIKPPTCRIEVPKCQLLAFLSNKKEVMLNTE